MEDKYTARTGHSRKRECTGRSADCGVCFHLFHIAHSREFVPVRDRISARIAGEFYNRKDMAFAYPTGRHIPIPLV
jgi:hypothetical protein